jgi:hypothetical protein
MKRLYFVAVALSIFFPLTTAAQSFKPEVKTPTPEALAAARKACTDLFTSLAAGKTEEIATWITNELGYMRDPASRMSLKNEFKSKLDLVVASPPVTPYGKLSGYDLIDESYLPNSSRYFRMTYISYHEAAPLIWEFRFYVKPDGKVALNYIIWSEKNPFEYLSSPDMGIPRRVS